MNDNRSFQKFAGIAVIVGAVLMYVEIVLIFSTFSPEVFASPTQVLATGQKGADLMRWVALLDVWGWYLLPIPAIVFIGHWLRSKSPHFVGLFTLIGVSLGFVGAVGGGIFGSVMPQLILDYGAASASQREVATIVFNAFMRLVDGGLFGGVPVRWLFFLGIGWYLMRERRALGTFWVVIGAWRLLVVVARPFSIGIIGDLDLLIDFFVTPILWLWTGIDLLRKPVDVKETEAASAAPAMSVSASRA